LSEGPFRDALEVARTASFSPEEWEAYERAKMAEQDARGALTVARQEGHQSGLMEGHKSGLVQGHKSGLVQGKRDTLLRLLSRALLSLSDEDRARIEACDDPTTLDRWCENVLGATTAAEVLS